MSTAVRPPIDEVTPVIEGMRLFRGVDYDPGPNLAPAVPRFHSADEWFSFEGREEADRVAYDHVVWTNLRGEPRPTCRSLSCQEKAAGYYGTSGYKRDGYIAECRLPRPLRLLDNGLYLCEGGIMILDPRRWSPLSRVYLTASSSFEFQKHCALVDDELILVCGSLPIIQLRRVLAADHASQNFMPWPGQTTFAKDAGVDGAGIPLLEDFDTYRARAAMAEEARRKLASILT